MSVGAELGRTVMQSIRKVQLGLFTVALGAGSLGVWSELQASPPEANRIVGRAIEGWSEDFSSGGVIGENGDGTAFVFAGAMVSDSVALQVFNPAAAPYSISGELRPGQGGRGAGFGTGQFSGDGSLIDLNTFEFTPTLVNLDLAVNDARNVGAYTQQGVNVVRDPLTGEASIRREHRSGSQAWGLTAGTFSISADGAVVAQGAGYGGVSLFRVNVVERIH